MYLHAHCFCTILKISGAFVFQALKSFPEFAWEGQCVCPTSGLNKSRILLRRSEDVCNFFTEDTRQPEIYVKLFVIAMRSDTEILLYK